MKKIRSQNMNKTITICSLLTLVLTGVHLNAAEKPNVIIILVDDMGFSDIGAYGGEIKTPHIDSLAQGGIRFSQFYNASRCCPTRATLMTGLHPHLTGIGHMTNSPNHNKYDKGEAFPSYRGFLNRQCATLGEVLDPAALFNLSRWQMALGRQ
jgi:arylsulfatase A-like enzyme